MSSKETSQILQLEVHPRLFTQKIHVELSAGKYIDYKFRIPVSAIWKKKEDLTKTEKKLFDDWDSAAREVHIGMSFYKYEKSNSAPAPSETLVGIESLELKFLNDLLYAITVNYDLDSGPKWSNNKEFSDTLSLKNGGF